MTKAPSPSETLVLTRTTRRYIPDNTILHSHRRENLKSYKLAEHVRVQIGLEETGSISVGTSIFLSIFKHIEKVFVLYFDP
jgi:hypothetical protein